MREEGEKGQQALLSTQERSAISLHSETVLMELALSVNMRQEIDHLWAQQLVACSLLARRACTPPQSCHAAMVARII